MYRTLASIVIASAAAMGPMTTQAMADPLPAAPTFAIGKCFNPNQPAPQRPTRFDYNCDGTGVMENMTWTSWGPDGAKGTGTDASIECQPNCAQGPLLNNPIIVHAWNPLPPSSTLCPTDVKFYSDLTIAYPNGVPPWIQPGTTWDDGTAFVTIDGKPAVHFSNLKPNCLPL
jgi:hypothetical protein